jgi:hypothetical protein
MIAFLVAVCAWAAEGDEISRSRGRPGEIVVLYPRVVPETDDPVVASLAERAADRLARVAASLPGAPPVERRPPPERSCPRTGCRTVSVGLLLGHQAGGCAAVALVSDPGPSPARLIPWIGGVRTVVPAAPWRVAPESEVVIEEFALCEDPWSAVSDEAIRRALADAIGASPPRRSTR